MSDEELVELPLIGTADLVYSTTIEVRRPKLNFIEVVSTSIIDRRVKYRTVYEVNRGTVKVLYAGRMVTPGDSWKFIKKCQEWGLDYS